MWKLELLSFSMKARLHNLNCVSDFIDKRQFMWLFAFSEMHPLGMRGGVRERDAWMRSLFCWSSQGHFMMEAFFLLVNEECYAGPY